MDAKARVFCLRIERTKPKASRSASSAGVASSFATEIFDAVEDEENRARNTACVPARKQRRRPALALGIIGAAITSTAVSPSHDTEDGTVSTRGLVGDGARQRQWAQYARLHTRRYRTSRSRVRSRPRSVDPDMLAEIALVSLEAQQGAITRGAAIGD